MVTVFAKLGQDAHIQSEKALSELINDDVRLYIWTQESDSRLND
jgi:hypothetical protein